MAARNADFAGSWYPARESDCRRVIEEFTAAAIPCPSGRALGGIVPHAGWVFSGKIACNVIRCLSEQSTPDTILVFGRHLHPSSKSYIMAEGSWATPLGEIDIDGEAGEKLLAEFPFVVETPTRYDQDNTIELQLPFIKHFFPRAKILPLGVPPATGSLRIGERAAEVLAAMGRKTLALGSTDLTHYGYNYGYAPKGVGKPAVDWVKGENDKRLVDRILKMDAEGVIRESLTNHNACCSGAVSAAIAAAKTLGARHAQKLLYATSYDVRPDNSFVGYVGVLFVNGG
jgi:AmmeMemoRadiSam system protein B